MSFLFTALRPLSAAASGADLEVPRKLVEVGTITLRFDRSYPLAEPPEAIRYFAEEHGRGKAPDTACRECFGYGRLLGGSVTCRSA